MHELYFNTLEPSVSTTNVRYLGYKCIIKK